MTNTQPKAIVYVDDNNVLRRIFPKILESYISLRELQGIEIVTANDGAEAKNTIEALLNKTGTEPVVITDYKMPFMSGLDLYLAMSEEQRELTVIVTGSPKDVKENLDVAYKHPYNAELAKPMILVKPVDEVTLFPILDVYFGINNNVPSGANIKSLTDEVTKPYTGHEPVKGIGFVMIEKDE